MAAKYGYIGNSPENSSVVVARQTFSPTGVTTTFTFASGYVIGYLDAYLNGSRLIEGQDYTASNGSSVDLISAAGNGDILELVAYKAFNAATIDTAPGNLTVQGKLTVVGVTSATNAVYTGVVTANSFVGNVTGNLTGTATTATLATTATTATNAQGLTGSPSITISSLSLGGQTVSTLGVGIRTTGSISGYGATMLDFRGSGISTVTVSSGIATINVTGGSSGGFNGVGYIMF